MAKIADDSFPFEKLDQIFKTTFEEDSDDEEKN